MDDYVEDEYLSDKHFGKVAEAFSRKSQIYDTFAEEHLQLIDMRRRVREHVLSFHRPGDRILELNAGTGADAAYLASHGLRVHATDIAPGMVEEIKRKIQSRGLENRLTLQVCSFMELEKVAFAPFDHVFSNMGGLNCTPDLAPVARGIEKVLRPAGLVTLIVMPRICPWELFRALRGDLRLAARRLHSQGVLASVEGVHFRTFYYSPKTIQEAFGPQFHLLHLQSLALFTPTADHKKFAISRPRLYRCLRALDRIFVRLPVFRQWGDFFMLTLRYSPSGQGYGY